MVQPNNVGIIEALKDHGRMASTCDGSLVRRDINIEGRWAATLGSESTDAVPLFDIV